MNTIHILQCTCFAYRNCLHTFVMEDSCSHLFSARSHARTHRYTESAGYTSQCYSCTNSHTHKQKACFREDSLMMCECYMCRYVEISVPRCAPHALAFFLPSLPLPQCQQPGEARAGEGRWSSCRNA